MIRLYLTTWTYIINISGIKESTNPIMEAIDANPQIIVTYSIIDSTMTNGEHDNPNVIIILKGDDIPDAADNLVGVKRIPIERYDMTIAEILPDRRLVIEQWLIDNTGVDTSVFTLATTIGGIIKAIAIDINPDFGGFGGIYESLVAEWQ